MDECLIVHSKAYSKVYIFYSFLFAIHIISFIIGTVNYCRSRYKLEYLEENNPDIDLTGIKSFDFKYESDYYILNDDYYYGKPDLGNTGKVYLVCYEGKCKYSYDDTCTREVCETDEYGEEECWDEEYTCTSYKSFYEYDAAYSCRFNGYCSYSYCSGYSYYDYDSCHCSKDRNAKKQKDYESCTADNLIFNFEYYYYDKENAVSDNTKYSYLKSAVTKNESCSEGKKFCGYLDDLGNKLCYDNYDKCPMNIIISDNKSEYYSKEIIDQRIYYTKEPDETNDNHRVLGGFFVDTDLMINYNVDNGDCQIITTGKISTLLDSHNNELYRDSLRFDPYKDKNIDLKGKSYLKWCIPGHGKEKNITLIKELNEVYEFNLTANKKSIKPIKKRFVASYFTALPGHIGLIISWVYILLLFNSMNNSSSSLGLNSGKSLIIYTSLVISLILVFIGSILSITNNSKISKTNKMDLGQTVFSSLIKLNITYFTLILVLIFGIIAFFIYLYVTPKSIFESNTPEKSYNLIEQENYKKNDNYNYNNNKTNYNNNAGYNNNYNNADFNAYNYNNNPDFNNNANSNAYTNNNNNQGYSGGGIY